MQKKNYFPITDGEMRTTLPRSTRHWTKSLNTGPIVAIPLATGRSRPAAHFVPPAFPRSAALWPRGGASAGKWPLFERRYSSTRQLRQYSSDRRNSNFHTFRRSRRMRIPSLGRSPYVRFGAIPARSGTTSLSRSTPAKKRFSPTRTCQTLGWTRPTRSPDTEPACRNRQRSF